MFGAADMAADVGATRTGASCAGAGQNSGCLRYERASCNRCSRCFDIGDFSGLKEEALQALSFGFLQIGYSPRSD